MHEANSSARPRGQIATLADVRRIVGTIDDGKALQVFALHPTAEELEDAAAGAAGNGDLRGKAGRPLSGRAAAIFDILTADEEEPAPAR